MSDTETAIIGIAKKTPAERMREPVTCGLPWPRGKLQDPAKLSLRDSSGKIQQLQTRVLDRWSDGSVRWVLLDWLATVSGGARYEVRADGAGDTENQGVHTKSMRGSILVETSGGKFIVSPNSAFPFSAVQNRDVQCVDPRRSGFSLHDAEGNPAAVKFHAVALEEPGLIRTAIVCRGRVRCGRAKLDLIARLHFFFGSPVVRMEITLRNPQRAEHAGGLWSLGDSGSVLFRDFALSLALPPEEGRENVLRWSTAPETSFHTSERSVVIHQDSSGGENWQSAAHRNREGKVPLQIRGYVAQSEDHPEEGHRATPVVSLQSPGRCVGVAMEHFWQNFPKAVEATGEGLVLRLFPHTHGDLHELQGGEQKTHRFHVAFSYESVAKEPLQWCRDPLVPRAAPEWYASTGALPYLLPRKEDPNIDYLRLVNHAIEGDDTFLAKRERIDEYGWRHFGDLYADHENVYYDGTPPLVSHYNNQYDAVAGFALQFMRSADERWWRLMRELAHHVMDIDIYHTDQDKAGYNGGLLWHTYHYFDAELSTHRGFPPTTAGGGPTAEHCYNAGLMLHHFLTGDAQAKEMATGLAQWIINMDDGRKSPFRYFHRGDTGWASMSGMREYHGPGRGAGNSVATLLVGHRLSGDDAFLRKAEQLIRRCIHPHDDIEAHDLLNAELRWYYTLFLHALGDFLDEKIERSELDRWYAYGRESLLHYARWMAEHEYPYLDKPDDLEYPTETWAAQDMRKSEVFKFAAKHASGEERERFMERAGFFFSASVNKLTELPTRTLTRPMVILCHYGMMHGYFAVHPDESAPPPAEADHDFGKPEVFLTQEERVMKRFAFLAKPIQWARGRR